jgi:hypothetical protein
MKALRMAVGLVVLCTACSSSKAPLGPATMDSPTDDSGADAAPGVYIQGFNPPPVAAGYTRFITPVIDNITPGFDELYCQWLTAPSASDQDVLDLTGLQSKYGHHIALYAETEVQPIGTSRVCTTGDMLGITFLGAIGGEGTNNVFKDLPPDTAFRLPKGQVLMANTHFLNAGSDTVEGEGVVDVEFAAPSPSRQIAGFFTNVGTTFAIPPHQPDYAYDVSCPLQADMQFFLTANHMHGYGTSAYTEIVHANGTKTTMTENSSWTSDMEFNPTFTIYPTGAMLSVIKGDTMHTHCEWTNTTAKAMSFPDEMCVGMGFNLSSGADVNCMNGQWPSP